MLKVDDWIKCPKCGHEVPKIEEYCPKCEHEIRAFVEGVPWWGIIGATIIGIGIMMTVITSKYVFAALAFIASTPIMAVYYFKKRMVERLSIKK